MASGLLDVCELLQWRKLNTQAAYEFVVEVISDIRTLRFIWRHRPINKHPGATTSTAVSRGPPR